MSEVDDAEAAFDEALAILRQTPEEIRERRRRKIVREIEERERQLQLLDSLPERSEGRVLPLPVEDLTLAVNGGAVPTKPQGLLRVIAQDPGRSWKLSDARDGMVERGWLQPGEKGTHQVQNTAWKLKKRGDLTSPRTGYYRITDQGLEAIRG